MFASLQTTVSIIATNAIYTKKTCFEYADVVWNNCAQYESNELEKNSEWSCTYCHRGNKVSLNFNNSLLLETGWDLSSRKNKYKLTFFLQNAKRSFSWLPLLTCTSYRHTHCVMPMIFKSYIHIHNFTATPFCRSRMEWTPGKKTRNSSSLNIFKTSFLVLHRQENWSDLSRQS